MHLQVLAPVDRPAGRSVTSASEVRDALYRQHELERQARSFGLSDAHRAALRDAGMGSLDVLDAAMDRMMAAFTAALPADRRGDPALLVLRRVQRDSFRRALSGEPLGAWLADNHDAVLAALRRLAVPPFPFTTDAYTSALTMLMEIGLRKLRRPVDRQILLVQGLTIIATIDRGDLISRYGVALRQDSQRRAAEIANSLDASTVTVIASVGDAAAALAELAGMVRCNADSAVGAAGDVNSAARSAEEAATGIAGMVGELSQAVEEVGRHTDDWARFADRTMDTVTGGTCTIEALDREVGEIGGVVQLIKTIASQTNLLALNASIEASRAGSFGEGFAVVAAEVKALARQTAEATDRIGRVIGNVQLHTKSAVAVMRSMVGMVEEMRSTATAIAVSVEQQASTSQGIAGNIDRAVRIIAGTGAPIVAITGAIRSLDHDSHRLLDIAETLKQRTDTLRTDTGALLQAIRGG